MKADFAETGAVRFEAVYTREDMAALGGSLDAVLLDRPGKRLTAGPWTDVLPPMTQIARGLIGAEAFPVRAVVFDKSSATNWAVAWHQDRTIAVRQRIDVNGFGPWSTKDGLQHVAPPVEVLQDMVTLRLHIDACSDNNAPLKVGLGTHRLGVVPAHLAGAAVKAHPILTCHANAGDVWAYSTLILHASERSRTQGRRRVLQIDYASQDLPGGLQWKGLG